MQIGLGLRLGCALWSGSFPFLRPQEEIGTRYRSANGHWSLISVDNTKQKVMSPDTRLRAQVCGQPHQIQGLGLIEQSSLIWLAGPLPRRCLSWVWTAIGKMSSGAWFESIPGTETTDRLPEPAPPGVVSQVRTLRGGLALLLLAQFPGNKICRV